MVLLLNTKLVGVIERGWYLQKEEKLYIVAQVNLMK